MTFLLTTLAATVAVAVEMIEALAIVLAVGMARRPRDAIIGGVAAAVSVVALCLIVGPGLLGDADLDALRVIIGTFLLLFGLEWLRKGVLRLAGRRARSDSYAEFIEEREALEAEPLPDGPDWAARAVAFKGVFLEGLEVGLIVLALGADEGQLAPALLGTAIALVLVTVIGLVLHEPLKRAPETELKLGVGIMLTAFGVFFLAEGMGVEWPGGDLALLYLIGLFGGVAWTAIGRERVAERA